MPSAENTKPAAQSSSPPPSGGPPNSSGPNLFGPKKILIVDDEDDIRRLVSLMLQKYGVESISVTNADDAVEMLAEYPDEIGLVLLDLSVPNSSDSAPLERIKRRHPRVPVIVITGQSPESVKIDPAYADSVGYLRKPFQPQALYEALGKRRAKRDSGGRARRRGNSNELTTEA